MSPWVRMYGKLVVPPPRSGPGLMTIPQVVWDAVDETMCQGDYPAGSEHTFAKWYATQYHFGGHEILYQETPEGLMVYSIGSEDIVRFEDTIPPEERHLYESREVDLWPEDLEEGPKSH